MPAQIQMRNMGDVEALAATGPENKDSFNEEATQLLPGGHEEEAHKQRLVLQYSPADR